MVGNNYLEIKDAVADMCVSAGRDKSDCTLIAVSKTKPVELLREAYDAGCRDFGENKVQELMDKYDKLPGDIRWHMIGHLQTNKVKYIVDKVAFIHSVDSMKLAREISKEACKKNLTVRVLLEVNVAKEATKYGFKAEELLENVREIALLPGVKVEGLMTIAPFVENSEDNRVYFKQLKQLAVDISAKNIDNISMNILSMGMSGDYLVAVSEGATYVRVGSSIFGNRTYS
ncbi:MAG: YggS family pyridoxal phosphate-dependent enzyme [Lachnospiraceae bacterium]|nr:YggS family pyridoxal phosphate-dependent enzyme [Lachnospiraceae bacterium]